MPESTTDWLVRLRSVTPTRTSVHFVIEREDRRAGRQSIRELVAWSQEHEDQSARLPSRVTDDPNVEDPIDTPAAGTLLRCACGTTFTDAFAALDHAASCVVRAAMPSRAALAPSAAATDDVIARYAAALTRATESLGSEGQARAWLQRPSRAFGGGVPALMLETADGFSQVLMELVRIDHGIIS